MPFDPDKLLARRFDDVEHSYSERDTMLYALGLGCGADPMDVADLRFVYENGAGLAALPTMPVVLGISFGWMQEPATGIDYMQVLHGEQGLELHGPVPASGTVVGRTRIVDIVDKGAAKGAFVYTTRDVSETASGRKIATLTQTTVLRGNGGFGGAARPSPPAHRIPARPADLAVDLATLPQAALIYRLSGDTNPLHADPTVAKMAGFERPILHGLCSFGVAGRALLKACCGNDPAGLKSMAVRFSAPVYPGETIRTEIWRDGATISFRARVLERDVVVIDNGRAEIVG